MSPLPEPVLPMPRDAHGRPLTGPAWAKPGRTGVWSPPDRRLTRGRAVLAVLAPTAPAPVEVGDLDDAPAPAGLLNEVDAAERARMDVRVLRRLVDLDPAHVGATPLAGRMLFRATAPAFAAAATITAAPVTSLPDAERATGGAR